jgi:hypothetical protein
VGGVKTLTGGSMFKKSTETRRESDAVEIGSGPRFHPPRAFKLDKSVLVYSLESVKLNRRWLKLAVRDFPRKKVK